MPDIEGEVEALSIKAKGWAVKIGPDWFNSFHKTHPDRGDVIKGFFETKEIGTNIFRNLKSFEILKFYDENKEKKDTSEYKPKQQIIPNTTQQDQIIRQACLKSAAAVVAAIINHAKDVKLNDAQLLTIQTAEAFKRYVENGPQEL